MQPQTLVFPTSLDGLFCRQQPPVPTQLPTGPSAGDNSSFSIKEDVRDTLVLPVLDLSSGTADMERLGDLITWYQLGGDSIVNTYHNLALDWARLSPHFGFAETTMIHDPHTPLKDRWSGITVASHPHHSPQCQSVQMTSK